MKKFNFEIPFKKYFKLPKLEVKMLFPYISAFFLYVLALIFGDLDIYFITILTSMFFIPFIFELSAKQIILFFGVIFSFLLFSASSLKKSAVEYTNIKTPEKIVISNGSYDISLNGEKNKYILEKYRIPKCDFVVTDRKEFFNLFGREMTSSDSEVLVCKEKIKNISQEP